MLKLHKQNDCFDDLFKALLFRKSSTVNQIFKELLNDIALLCQRTEPSNRDIVKLKDLPTLELQIVNQPILLKLLKVLAFFDYKFEFITFEKYSSTNDLY